jgi:hypothetical protein
MKSRNVLENHSRSSSIGDQTHLDKLRRVILDMFQTLSATIRIWDEFVRPDGDMRWFSDLHDCHTSSLLRKIDENMGSMRMLKPRLEALDVWCKDRVESVSFLF